MGADEEKIAELVFQKLKADRSPDRDKEFARELAEMLHEHRAPCHDLTDEDVKSLRGVIKTAKKLDRGVFWLFLTLGGLIIKTIYDYLTKNLHWGQ